LLLLLRLLNVYIDHYTVVKERCTGLFRPNLWLAWVSKTHLLVYSKREQASVTAGVFYECAN